MNESLLLPTAYLAPVPYYAALYRAGEASIEVHEHYVKQTFRNRCMIAGPDGPFPLSVPVVKPESPGMPVCQVRISDHGNWRHLHWNALTSAYGESPFFEYYEDDIRPFFEKQYTFLLDFNMETTAKMCELLDIEPNIVLSEEYLSADALTQSSANGDVVSDFRDAIRPKRPLEDLEFSPKPYYQVFSQKHGFLPNLSILDLLFNEGNESVLFL